jgi:hypothetical protein
MLHHTYRLLLSAMLIAMVAPPSLHAGGKGDQVHFGNRIVIEENEQAGDLVCIGCSISMSGSCGDVVAIGGSISVNGAVKGDTVAVGGHVQLGQDASVSGDVVAIGGGLSRHPNAAVKGDITSQSGAPILLALVIVPLLPVVLIVALIVWLVNRSRRPALPGPA